MKLIIDTNLWISFTIGKQLSTLEQLLKSKQVEIYVCKELIDEYKDVKDLYLLSLADTIPADYIISGDKDLLVLEKHNATRILDYKAFLSMLQSQL